MPRRKVRDAEPGHGIAAASAWLEEVPAVEGVVAVQPVLIAQVVTDVYRPLVQIYGRGRALSVAQDEAVEREPLAMAQPLVREKEERPVLDEGATEVAAEQVALK